MKAGKPDDDDDGNHCERKRDKRVERESVIDASDE
jgi:hypothetical protein